jgi:hypothetical protein
MRNINLVISLHVFYSRVELSVVCDQQMAPPDLCHDSGVQNGGGMIEFRATQINFEVILQILQCV